MLTFLAVAALEAGASDVGRWSAAIELLAAGSRKAISSGADFTAAVWSGPTHDAETTSAWTTCRAVGILGVGVARLDERRSLLAALGIPVEAPFSDLDVLAFAYEKWGDSFASRVDGDYAVVLWDERAKRLVAVRDPFGSVPLLYAENSNALLVSTDIEPLVNVLGSKPPIDDRMVLEYLLQDFQSRTRTFFRGVSRVIPGHSLVAWRGQTTQRKYWVPPSVEQQIAGDEVPSAYRELLQRSTARQTRGARRLAVDLSGGLDSSSIAAIAVQQADSRREPMPPFTLWHMAFPGLATDESVYADAMEAHLGVPVRRLAMTGDVDPVLASSLSVCPPGRSDMFGEYHQALLLEGTDVVLGGEGGDSLNFEAAVMADLAAARDWCALATELIPRPDYNSLGRMFWARLVLSGLVPHRVQAVRRRFTRRPRIPTWLGPALRTAWQERCEAASRSSGQSEGAHASNIQRATWQSLTNPTMEWILDTARWVFRRYEMEVRYPFLDAALARFVLSLSPALRLPHGLMRRLQRDAMAEMLPSLVRDRRRATYFDSYVKSAIPLMIRRVEPALLRAGWHAEAYVPRGAFTRALPGRSDAGDELPLLTVWHIATLELWLRRTAPTMSSKLSTLFTGSGASHV